MAKLRFDRRDGGAYHVIVPGDAGKSKLYARVSASDPAVRMPPRSSGHSLTKDQIELIGEWINQGAKWENHWAYEPPKRAPPPEVSNTKWPRNAIDHFILARLEREGLKPSPRAGKATLLRRVTFDLTGLPPTPAELDSFLADPSPDAYEKRVDRLLASAHYGERMAMQWLDLARYADTHGYHIDSARSMWHWRDWVIDAFSRNLPFDEFTIEQIAGDLLPHATLAQKIATGFNRNHMINFEGGAIPEEYQNEYVVDRVETTSVAFLGMTMGCARCHDHKYDPISQKDFYRFYAFFNNIPEKGLDGRRGNAAPVVQIPSEEQVRELERVNRELPAKEKELSQSDAAKLQARWEETALDKIPEAPRDHLLAHYELDGSFADSSGGYRNGRILAGDLTYSAGVVGKAADFDGETEVDLGSGIAIDRDKPFSIACWLRSSGTHEMQVLQSRGFDMTWEESYPIGDLRRGAALSVRLDAIEVRTRHPLPISSKEGLPRPWYQVTVKYDGSGRASGLKLFVNGQEVGQAVSLAKAQANGLRHPAWKIGSKALGKPYKGAMDDLRFYSRELSATEIEQLTNQEPARATLLLAASKRSKEQQERLREYFLTREAPEQLRALWADIEKLREEARRLVEEIPTSMVMEEMPKPRETVILGRGDYRNRGEKVTPGVPSFLPPLPKDAPLNRLGLAKWLVDPSNPLTARVAVNRYWRMYFAAGIVKTSEDFGSQGEEPTHPELLDWLATEFIRTGWDIKAMQRLIVTSETYCQSSRETPALRERDPENRLLARGPRFRLPAEMVRDNALRVSGLLNETVGGPSVFPYQPKGIWEDIAYGDVTALKPTHQVMAPISIAAVCTPSGSAPARRPRSAASTLRTARSA